MTIVTRTVTEDEADIRLDRWFRRHFPGTTQGVIEKLCRTGQVRVDGHRAEAGDAARARPERAHPAAARAAAANPPAPRRLPPDPKLLRALEAMVLWRDDAADRAGQAAGPADPGRPRHHPPSRRHAGGLARPTGSGRAWCTGWTATPPA